MKGFVGGERVQEKIETRHFSFARNLISFVTQGVGLIHLMMKQKQKEG